MALVERHRSTGRVQVGLVQGFGFTEPCAVATTVAHDSHQMIVVGTDEADMALAANRLAEIGGGQVVVRRGEIDWRGDLPIAGLMSNERADRWLPQKAATVLAGFRACGCRLNNPNMQLSLLGLVVIPELRISDLGLVDVNRFRVHRRIGVSADSGNGDRSSHRDCVPSSHPFQRLQGELANLIAIHPGGRAPAGRARAGPAVGRFPRHAARGHALL